MIQGIKMDKITYNIIDSGPFILHPIELAEWIEAHVQDWLPGDVIAFERNELNLITTALRHFAKD